MYQKILEFWFDEASPAQWWKKDATFDHLVAEVHARNMRVVGFETLGLHPAFLFAVVEAGLEVVGSILIALGFLTRWASAALAISMAVAIWKVHFQWGFFLNWTGAPDRGHGMEFAFILCFALVALALTGGGDWSIDGRNQRAADRDAAGRARLRNKM